MKYVFIAVLTFVLVIPELRADPLVKCEASFSEGDFSNARKLCFDLVDESVAAKRIFAISNVIEAHGYERFLTMTRNVSALFLDSERNVVRDNMPLLREAAVAGDAEANYYYGLLYAVANSDITNGKAFSDARAEGERWIVKAANQGLVLAKYTLAWRAAAFDGDENIFVDLEKLPYLEEVSNLGDSEMSILWSKVQEWRAAQGQVENLALNGNAKSLRTIGFQYLNADGREFSEETGIQYLEKAAEKGDIKALLYLGDKYISSDRIKAREYLSAAANAGATEGFISLGNLAACELNMNEAIKYYQKAILMGDELAKYAIEELEVYGVGEDYCK